MCYLLKSGSGLNRIMILFPCLSMISSENRFPLFRIML